MNSAINKKIVIIPATAKLAEMVEYCACTGFTMSRNTTKSEK